MNASSVLANLLRLRMNEAQMASELHESDQPVRLLPVLEPEELPPEFEQVLQIQVLGYRERLTLLHGRRLRVLDPVWTLVPKTVRLTIKGKLNAGVYARDLGFQIAGGHDAPRTELCEATGVLA